MDDHRWLITQIGVFAPSLSIIFTCFSLKTGESLLVVLLLHASLNVLPDLGFSRYDPSILVLTFIVMIISFSLACLPLMRNTA